MSVYLGSLGRLVELSYVSSQSVETSDRFTFEQSLEGRVLAQARPSARRKWSLSGSRYLAQDQGTLMSFINGEWGYGPFMWVSSDAQVTNMLTPEQASCDPLLVSGASNTVGGPMLTPDGWAGRSYTNSDSSRLLWLGVQHTPVLPGKPVTVSAYLLGANARVRLYFYDAAGVNIENHLSTVAASSGSVRRSHVTAIAPADAVSCRVLGIDAVQGCRPAVTWTPSLFDWADGQGCHRAVVHGASKDVQSAHYDPRGHRAANISFTVTEVG